MVPVIAARDSARPDPVLRQIWLRQTQFGFAPRLDMSASAGHSAFGTVSETQPERSGRLSRTKMANFFKAALLLARKAQALDSAIITAPRSVCQSIRPEADLFARRSWRARPDAERDAGRPCRTPIQSQPEARTGRARLHIRPGWGSADPREGPRTVRRPNGSGRFRGWHLQGRYTDRVPPTLARTPRTGPSPRRRRPP